jgi:hypothetical protein
MMAFLSVITDIALRLHAYNVVQFNQLFAESASEFLNGSLRIACDKMYFFSSFPVGIKFQTFLKCTIISKCDFIDNVGGN